jgi:hypothetical protein
MDAFITMTFKALANAASIDFDFDTASSPSSSSSSSSITTYEEQPPVDYEKNNAPDNAYNAWCVVA